MVRTAWIRAGRQISAGPPATGGLFYWLQVGYAYGCEENTHIFPSLLPARGRGGGGYQRDYGPYFGHRVPHGAPSLFCRRCTERKTKGHHVELDVRNPV